MANLLEPKISRDEMSSLNIGVSLHHEPPIPPLRKAVQRKDNDNSTYHSTSLDDICCFSLLLFLFYFVFSSKIELKEVRLRGLTADHNRLYSVCLSSAQDIYDLTDSRLFFKSGITRTLWICGISTLALIAAMSRPTPPPPVPRISLGCPPPLSGHRSRL